MKFTRICAAFVAALAVAVAVIPGAAGAAKKLVVTGGDVKNNSLTGKDIKNISSADLTPGLRKLIAQGGTQGPAGANGKDGAPGANGQNGVNGKDGTNGTNGKDGANPGIPVKASGDQGFVFSGGSTAAGTAAYFAHGALHLPGGFDSGTAQGAIALAKPYANVPLNTLSAIGYTYSENKRSQTDKASIHVTVTGAVKGVDSKFDSGFTNLVYNPVYNGLANQRDATTDTFAPGNGWYSTGAQGQSGSQAQPISIQAFQARNPNAVIAQISIDNGGSSNGTSAPGDTDISADNLVIGFGGVFDRYDLGG